MLVGDEVQNHMVMGREEHDPQERPDKRPCECCVCGYRFWPEEVYFIGGRAVCGDDENEYLLARGGPYREDYIERHEKDFYLDFWFADLRAEDRAAIAKAAYRYREAHMLLPSERDRLEQERADYCADCDEFPEFVRAKLDEEEYQPCF